MAASLVKTSPPPPFKITDSTQLEDWKKWQRSFRYYANAINLDQESHDVQLSTFKSLVGPDGLEIYNTFSILETTDVESVMRKFDDHFKPKVNVNFERYKLYRLYQKSGQKFDDYLADITSQVDKCEFKSMRDEIILYKIVGGIESDEVRNVLLADADLKFSSALEICRASSTMHFMSGKGNAQAGAPKKIPALDDSKGSGAKGVMTKDERVGFDGDDSDWIGDDHSDASDDDDYKPVAVAMVKRKRLKEASVRKEGNASETSQSFPCNVCGRLVGSKKDLSRHLMTHSKVEKVTCHHCGGQFKQKRYLLRHIVRSHPGIMDSGTPQIYVCDVCGYKTNVGANMRRHKYQHTEDRPFSCELCEYKCIVPRLMKAHMAKHTGERPFACSVCQKGFVEQIALKKHMFTHMSPEEREKQRAEEKQSSARSVESSATCETCGKVFSSRGALKTHSVTHTGERPFACTVCDYRAGQRAALNAHMAKHSEEKPFVCTVCGYSCKLKRVLQTHMHTHTGDRPYACKMCDNKFKQLAHLTVHMRTHTGEKPYVCDICGHRWAKQSNLTQHMKVHQNQTGDPSQYTTTRKRQKKRRAEAPAPDPAPVPAPANAIPQWSEQVSAINPMECFLNLETPPSFHPTYSTPHGNPRPPDCRYYQQRQ